MARVKVYANAVDNLSNSQIEHLINEWCKSEKYREILKYKFIDGYTYEQIAEIVDMSARQIKNIVYKQGDKVLYHIPLN